MAHFVRETAVHIAASHQVVTYKPKPGVHQHNAVAHPSSRSEWRETLDSDSAVVVVNLGDDENVDVV